jgi:sugar lactone lactonase YvrE
VAFDSNGNIYAGDCANHRVQIFSSAGVYSATLGSYGQGEDQFYCPTGLTFDDSSNLYVADTLNHRVQIFDSSLSHIATLGETGVSGSDTNHFNEPHDVAVDGDGNLYIVDTFNHRVQKFDDNHDWQMTLGVTGECGADVGSDFERFCVPMGLAVDGSGNVYVSEYWNPRVQVFASSGAYLTTIGGAWGDHSSQFHHISGVAVDTSGNIYIPDMLNHRVQKFAPGVPGWQQVNINGFGERYAKGITALEVFMGQLYAGTSTSWEMGTGGRVYRSSDGLSWSAVSEPNFGVNTGTISTIFDLAVFNGQLYASIGSDGIHGQVWRSPDGVTWEPVITDGFGDESNDAVSSFAVYNGLLYAGTGNHVSSAQIWRSASGDSGDWTKVAPDESGTQYTYQVTGFAVFNDSLYAAVETTSESQGPAQVWRSANGSAWDTVIPDGFGDADNYLTGGFAEFGDHLYLGTRNDISGAQIWRSANGVSWEQVVGDGFGDSANYKVEMLIHFAGQLYTEVNNFETGLKILRTSNGVNWEQINPDGFGDSNNWGILLNNSTAKYQGRLHTGTWNPANGGEIWRYDLEEKTLYLPAILR